MHRIINNSIIAGLFSALISCGGSSSYPVTSSDSGSGYDGTVTTTLDLSDYDSCEYYGLQESSTGSSYCYQYGTSTDTSLSAYRNAAGSTISVDSNLNGSGSGAGFVGANTIMQVAEAKAVLDNLGYTIDGSNTSIAIVGSGVNNVGSNLNTGTSYNYGYLNNANNIEDIGIYSTAYAAIGSIDGYSIYNKNTSEAFSLGQGYTSVNSPNFYYTGSDTPLRTSKFQTNDDGSGYAVSYVYNIASGTSGTTSSSNHLTGLSGLYDDMQVDDDPLTSGFDEDVMDYDTVTSASTTTFCADDSCTRSYHVFLSQDYSGATYEYQSSIFEYGHNDVANGTALASIVGIDGDSNLEGAASGATINSYKTQIYHRKLIEANGTFISPNDGDYMDSVLEDNTGLILYNALNAAQASNDIVLLNNQYRNYQTQFSLAFATTASTNFSVSYDVTSDPTQLTEFEEFEFYRLNSNVGYSLDTASSIYADAGSVSTGGNAFVTANFIDSDTLASSGSNPGYANGNIEDFEIWTNTGENYGNSGTYKYLTDSDVASEYSTNITNITNLLKSSGTGSDNIYVIPTDNSFFISLVNTLSTSNDNTIVAVADVAVDSITYSSSALDFDFNGDSTLDYDGIYKISSIALDTNYTSNVNGDEALISVNDCSAVTNAACFIAPGNAASLNSDGDYTAFDSLDTSTSTDGIDQGEYLGSAYVTSAIAVLVGAWSDEIADGDITMSNIVAKLQATAIPASSITGCIGDGASGTVDCGDGMINLLDAVNSAYTDYIYSASTSGVSAPVIYTTSSANDFAYDLASTSLTTSLFFGDALTKNAQSILSKAEYYDSFNFSYNAGLDKKVSTELEQSSSRYALTNYFDFDDETITTTQNVPLGNAFSFNITSEKSKYQDNEYTKQRIFQDPEAEDSDVTVSNLNFTQNVSKNAAVKIGFNSYDTEANTLPSQYAVNGSLAFSSGNEYASLLGDDAGFSSLSFNLSKNLNTYVGFSASESNGSKYLYSKLNYDLGSSFISFSFGTLIESEEFLGSEAEGAFNFGDNSETTYYGIAFVKNFANDLRFISKVDYGITRLDADQYSVFEAFDEVRSRETSFALVKNKNNTTYGMVYTEPMRVEAGNAYISVPTRKSYNGDIYYTSDWVSLESSGRERDYEFFVTQNLDDDSSVTFNYMYITDPNHIVTNTDEQLYILKYSKTF